MEIIKIMNTEAEIKNQSKRNYVKFCTQIDFIYISLWAKNKERVTNNHFLYIYYVPPVIRANDVYIYIFISV